MIINDGRYHCFSIDCIPDAEVPLIELYGLRAIISSDVDDVIVCIKSQMIIDYFEAIQTGEHADIGWIYKLGHHDASGEIYIVPSFRIGEKDYVNVPMIFKDIQTKGVDIIIGRRVFGPNSFSLYNNVEHKVEFYYGGLSYNKKYFWIRDQYTGSWFELTPRLMADQSNK